MLEGLVEPLGFQVVQVGKLRVGGALFADGRAVSGLGCKFEIEGDVGSAESGVAEFGCDAVLSGEGCERGCESSFKFGRIRWMVVRSNCFKVAMPLVYTGRGIFTASKLLILLLFVGIMPSPVRPRRKHCYRVFGNGAFENLRRFRKEAEEFHIAGDRSEEGYEAGRRRAIGIGKRRSADAAFGRIETQAQGYGSAVAGLVAELGVKESTGIHGVPPDEDVAESEHLRCAEVRHGALPGINLVEDDIDLAVRDFERPAQAEASPRIDGGEPVASGEFLQHGLGLLEIGDAICRDGIARGLEFSF